MPRVYWIVFFILALPATADGGSRDVFEGVLQGLAGELDRQQQDAARRQHEARSLYEACMAGSGPACDLAVTHRALDGRARQAIRARMRAIDAEREAQLQAYRRYTTDWTHCSERDDADACTRALAYPSASDTDRQQLLSWRADITARALAAQRQREAEAARVLVLPPEPSPTTVAPPIATGSAPDAGRSVLIAGIWLGVLGATVAGVVWLVQPPAAMPSRAHHPAFASADISAPAFVPMTGDFPTDVRRILAAET